MGLHKTTSHQMTWLILLVVLVVEIMGQEENAILPQSPKTPSSAVGVAIAPPLRVQGAFDQQTPYDYEEAPFDFQCLERSSEYQGT